jgi:hypothetical protein
MLGGWVLVAHHPSQPSRASDLWSCNGEFIVSESCMNLIMNGRTPERPEFLSPFVSSRSISEGVLVLFPAGGASSSPAKARSNLNSFHRMYTTETDIAEAVGQQSESG